MQPFDLTQGDTITAQGVQANNVDGMTLSVRTDMGNRVTAWRAGPAVTGDGRFFCHGYSLGTFGAHKYTVYGSEMPRVLADEYRALGQIGTAQHVASRDILVWWIGGTNAYHSAVVEEPHLKPDNTLDPATTVISSKTGTGPLWKGAMADDVKKQYQRASYIEVYRRL